MKILKLGTSFNEVNRREAKKAFMKLEVSEKKIKNAGTKVSYSSSSCVIFWVNSQILG